MKAIQQFFPLVLVLLFVSGPKTETTVTSQKMTRPNIVFLIADDWSYPHAGIYGDATVRTPTFDWLATHGALFDNAYCAAPSCSPSRASILLGRYPHQLESAGNLWSVIPKKFPNWVSILEKEGYLTGKSRKGWGPGDYVAGGYDHNPAGKDYPDFEAFLKDREKSQPFCYWFGSNDPHRIYQTNTGGTAGMDYQRVEVPQFLPDQSCVRNDLLDYYFEVERFDRECGQIIAGMPFPRAKANLYDYGTRMPLAIYWKGHIDGGQRISDFMNFIDFGPTFLEAAGIEPPKMFQGNSLMELFNTKMAKSDRSKVFLERERHANVRKGDLSYPSRAVRTKDFLYIKNFEPDRWPAGDPETHQSVGQYGDVDNSISKFLIMDMKGQPQDIDYFGLAFGKRPAEELYVLADDPYNLENQANNEAYRDTLLKLRQELAQWMLKTNDLRAAEPQTIYWDTVRYTPNYQMHDFNLKKEIDAYEMLKRDGDRSSTIDCSGQ